MKVQFIISAIASALVMAGCASQSPQPQVSQPPVNKQQQLEAQQQVIAEQPVELALKRKIAVGRLSNETNYGRSLLREATQGREDQKISDMFTQAIANTNKFQIFERPDIAALQAEQNLTAQTAEIVGVDTLVVGSLTEFGRSNVGERGFFSTSAKQEATATVDLRLVDTKTGQIIASVSGTGSSSLEQSRTMGFGSVAGYDGSLNDQAIGAAVNAAVEKMTAMLLQKPWSADILAVEEGQVFISGGESQGVKPGMTFAVMTKGKRIKSKTTGSYISLPGEKVAELKITSLFGNSELDQGAMGTITSGSIEGHAVDALEVQELKQ
ncbi:CsgG/HfaB family protein [Pseudidiomarina donghaiensis]|uniref:Curli production assembly/transport component CsgG n=1 Tax=Pseudidiomarina donghaiensis TaxID=519452 RepID=A0A432XHG1_9GAMM|nr:CsgG/HfaB family protein [Pseudidiomarina donghaiensis]RUO48007.1 curli production assembly protein CsgG [Pseudidiomarina donghaiensis]SFV22758.1 Curli biogenesis system outer membrane secretion channel CsgG [Pseudidiomarina donghaiensis]